jgi:hypothetical protein|tara:strand:- start:44 stop:643 length:600 start_codon:yes stop_codon:yes gene_type:complete
MKWLIFFLGILIVCFFAFQLFWRTTVSKIESYPFQVLKEYEDISIRKYDARLFLSVKMNSSQYETSSKKGFSILAGYIFGDNSKGEKIPMTSPVSISLEDSMTMMFMIPKEFNQDDMPEPSRSDINIKKEKSKTAAAISFGGWANSIKIERYKNLLIQSLKKKGISHTNKFYFLGYNPPFEIINRKNEIIVELNSHARF